MVGDETLVNGWDGGLLYCIGDSQTSGCEIADDLLWPQGHPGFYTHGELPGRDMAAVGRYLDHCKGQTDLGSPIGWPALMDLEKSHAWPARLGRMLGAEVMNLGERGASTEYIARQALTDISRLLADRPGMPITAIVQPAHFLRMQLHVLPRGWMSMMMSHPGPDMDHRIHRWLAENETDGSLITRWLVSMIGLISALGNMGIRTVLLDSGWLHVRELLPLRDGVADLAGTYLSMSDGLWLPDSMLDIAGRDSRCYCPGGHYRREVHEAVAMRLASVLS